MRPRNSRTNCVTRPPRGWNRAAAVFYSDGQNELVGLSLNATGVEEVSRMRDAE